MTQDGNIKILAVDDEPFMLKVLKQILDNLGYEQATFMESAQKALDLLDESERQPDVILLDLKMPEMDGVEFVRELVKRDFTGNIILISGTGERVMESVEKLVRAHRIRILGYLPKPVKPEKLSALLDMAAPKSREEPVKTKQAYSTEEIKVGIQNQELINFYQPQVDIASGRVVGVESLVRWRHPVNGTVFPDQFIPAAEKSGLIKELTRQVLINAFSQARAWQNSGLNLRIAVNLSMNDLDSLDFPDLVADLAASAEVPSEKIVLELTETGLMRNRLDSMEVLTRLKLRGFTLSIDDFGTGNSTLSMLRDIPFDELKVDRGFISGAWNNTTIQAIYSASLDMARQLDIQVVAEGVEDRNDWDFLSRTGCHMAQGYFIARPMPGENLQGWIQDWENRRSELTAGDI